MRDAATPTIDQLLQRVAIGDRDAYRELYLVSFPIVFAVVRRVLVDPAQSEEVAQEVLLEIWLKAGGYRPGSNTAGGWITTIAGRRAIDRIRAVEAGRDRERRARESFSETPRDHVWEHMESAATAETVRDALGVLTPRQREAVELAHLDGFTVAQVAAHLGITRSAAKTRVRDGLIALRTLFSGDGIASPHHDDEPTAATSVSVLVARAR